MLLYSISNSNKGCMAKQSIYDQVCDESIYVDQDSELILQTLIS